MIVQPIVKGQGLKRGERVKKIGRPIRFVKVTREPLGWITPEDCAREGFPFMTRGEFVELYNARERRERSPDRHPDRIRVHRAGARRPTATRRMSGSPICQWCKGPIPGGAGVAVSSLRRFCSKACRQSAYRLRKRSGTVATNDGVTSPGSFRYADPPYPGLAAKYYRDEPTFAGEVDFARLIRELEAARVAGECLGWALSTSARSLRELLPLCPPDARVCAWVKPIGACSRSYGLHNTWEPVIVMPGRRLRPGKRDWLRAGPARGAGRLPGRKPIAFCAWLFDLLGMLPGDTLVDLFPGTGAVSRAWAELSRRTAATPAAPSRRARATSAGAGATAAASRVPGTTAAASPAPGSPPSFTPGPTQARLL